MSYSISLIVLNLLDKNISGFVLVGSYLGKRTKVGSTPNLKLVAESLLV